jgi:hypothetical protein
MPLSIISDINSKKKPLTAHHLYQIEKTIDNNSEQENAEMLCSLLHYLANPQIYFPKDSGLKSTLRQLIYNLIKLHQLNYFYTDASGNTPLSVYCKQANPLDQDLIHLLMDKGSDPRFYVNGKAFHTVIFALKDADLNKKVNSAILQFERRKMQIKLDLDNKEADSLLSALRSTKLPRQDIVDLGQYSDAKETLIEQIRSIQPLEEQHKIIQEALTKGTQLHQFFAVKRGWLETSFSRGSFAKLIAMKNDNERLANSIQLIQLQMAPIQVPKFDIPTFTPLPTFISIDVPQINPPEANPLYNSSSAGSALQLSDFLKHESPFAHGYQMK